MTDEEYSQLRDNLNDEFARLSYPIYNPMEMASDLSDGADTVFEGEAIEYEASKFATRLRKHLDDCPNEGFPYNDKESLVEDTIEALKIQGIID
jgi:hypothetical protein